MSTALTGRWEALQRVHSLLKGRGVAVVAGAAGIGKTALSDAVADEWRTEGGTVQELRGTHGLQRVPFGAFASLWSLGGNTLEAGMAGQLLASVVAAGRAGLVVVDDAHLLDPESAALIAQAAQTPGVHVLMAITTGEPVPADLTAIWTRWPDCRIDLEPLTAEEVGEMVTALLGRPIDAAISRQIALVTLGYPLYVAAIAFELMEQVEVGAAGSGDLPWLVDSSDRLTGLLERRLSRLGNEERRLFDTIAFAGLAPNDVVTTIESETALARLEMSDLIRIGPHGVAVAHQLLAIVARHALTLDVQRMHARTLLDAISGSTDPEGVAVLVRAAVELGVVPEEELLVVAARSALAWGDFTGAALIAGYAPDNPDMVVTRAKALRFLGGVPEEMPAGLDEGSRAEFLSATSQTIAFGERRFGDAIALLQGGIASLTEPRHQDRLALELMILSGLAGDLDALLDAARFVADGADADTHLLAIAVSLFAEGLTLSTSGADATYDKGLQITATGNADPMLVEQLEISRALVDLAEARFGAARDLLGASTERRLVGSWLTVESLFADAWCPMADALDVAERAVEALEQFDPLGNLAQASFVADLRRVQAGVPGTPDVDVEQMDHPGVAQIDQLMRQRMQAWQAWVAGDSMAHMRLAEVGREAVALGHRMWGLAAFVDATRLGGGREVASDIEHLAITKGAGLAVLAGRSARASTSGDFWESARMWWEIGASTWAIESAIRAADPAVPIDGVRVQLMSGCGAVPVVGTLDPKSRPLSERQLDILSRVLGGASNGEVADALFLSRRTVENHLHRIYRVLEVKEGREGLVDLLGWIHLPARG